MTEAAEVREAPAPPEDHDRDRGVFVRAGAGIGRGQLFLGSAHAREASRIPLGFDIGALVADGIGVSATIVIEPGRTDQGIAMTRVASGGSFELHYGPMFVAVGPHVTWFGATRKTKDEMLWRLGLGVHAMLGLDIHATTHAGVFTAVRADGDALLAIDGPTVPWGSVTGVIGASFY